MLAEEDKVKIDRQRERNIAHVQYFLDRNELNRALELKLLRYLERYDDSCIEKGDITDSNILIAIIQYATKHGESGHPRSHQSTYICNVWAWAGYIFKLKASDGDTWYEIDKGSRTIYNSL